jgi:hypothetical protein
MSNAHEFLMDDDGAYGLSQEGTQERKRCLDPADRYLQRRIPSLGKEEEIVKRHPWCRGRPAATQALKLQKIAASKFLRRGCCGKV